MTTGLLVQRMQRDPELPGVAAVVIDECHERHLDADLLLAFCLDVRATLRADLALVATSATPDTAALAHALDAPVITATSAAHEIDIVWAPPPRPLPLLPGQRVDPRLLDHVADVTRRALAEGDGDVLVFVPGEREIAARRPGARRRARRPAPAVRAAIPRRAGPRPHPCTAAPGRRHHLGGRELADRARRARRGRRRAGPRTTHRPGPRARRADHHPGVEVLGGPARRPGRARGAGARLPVLVARRARPPRRAPAARDRHRRPGRVRAGHRRLGSAGRHRPGAARPAAASRPGRRHRPAAPARRHRRRRPHHRSGPADGRGGRASAAGPCRPRRRGPGRCRAGARGRGAAVRRLADRTRRRPGRPLPGTPRRPGPRRRAPLAAGGAPARQRRPGAHRDAGRPRGRHRRRPGLSRPDRPGPRRRTRPATR